jgi:predicted HicB family RNase H-like nuclease
MSTAPDRTGVMPRIKKLSGPMSIRLDPDVREALEELAKSDDRSVSSYINRVLRQHVEGIPKKPKART